MLFQNEIGPVNEGEFFVINLFLLLSVFFNNIVIGEIYEESQKLVDSSVTYE